VVFRLFKRKDKTTQALARTRKGWGGGLGALFAGATLSDEALWEKLEDALVSADVGVETSLALVNRVRGRVRDEGGTDVAEMFKEELALLLDPEDTSVWDWYDREDLPVKPFVLMVVGVNGAGKTTSIAKLVKLYQEDGRKVLLGAADTFRAAAIDQLQAWGTRLGVEVIAHRPGADPGAVAFDALRAARARNADVVIIDTAGRLHTKVNLMEEIRKVQRVISRQENRASQMVMLTLDATAGQNGLFQARAFTEALQCDGVFLAKLDGTAKGGVVLAIADELRLSVLYVGTGEQPDDIAAFDPAEFVDALFGSEESGQAR
jgi:fused signal recognition particle receptor